MENRSLNSLVSLSEGQLNQYNDEIFMDSLARLDPELWLIKSYLLRYRLNPAIIPTYIEQLARVDQGSGWGKIVTEIREHRAVFCEGTDSRRLDLEISDMLE